MEEKIEEVASKLEEVRHDYGIDRVELGKVMVIVSTALFVVSGYAAMSLGSAHSRVENLDDSLETTVGIINSENFQDSLDTLRSLQSRAINQQLSVVTSSLSRVEVAENKSSRVAEKLEKSYRMFQWVALAGFLGIAGGVAVIYV